MSIDFNGFIKNSHFHYRFLDHRAHPYWRIQSTKRDGTSNISSENVCIGQMKWKSIIVGASVHCPLFIIHYYFKPFIGERCNECPWKKPPANVAGNWINLASIRNFIHYACIIGAFVFVYLSLYEFSFLFCFSSFHDLQFCCHEMWVS